MKEPKIKLDILAFGAHPDDVEAGAGGLLAKAHKLGYKTGIVDFTPSQLSTNGTVKLRQKEADAGRKILGCDIRENLKMSDGNVQPDKKSINKVIKIIRKYQPDIVLAPYMEDRHPDHERAGELLTRAAFLAGLLKVETGQEKWRPKQIFYYMLHYDFEPSFILDISDTHDTKIKSLLAYKSQFNPNHKGSTQSYINRPEFLEFWEVRAKYYGYKIGTRYGEPYKIRGTYPGITDPKSLLTNTL